MWTAEGAPCHVQSHPDPSYVHRVGNPCPYPQCHVLHNQLNSFPCHMHSENNLPPPLLHRQNRYTSFPAVQAASTSAACAERKGDRLPHVQPSSSALHPHTCIKQPRPLPHQTHSMSTDRHCAAPAPMNGSGAQ